MTDQHYPESLRHCKRYWQQQVKRIQWFGEPRIVPRKDAQGDECWQIQGTLNSAYLALDYHVLNGRGEQLALVCQSVFDLPPQTYSYNQLTEKVARCAGALAELGVSQGDRVLIYLPLLAETLISMLACARLGAVHVVIAAERTAVELAQCLDQQQAKLLISASAGYEGDTLVAYQPRIQQGLLLAQHQPDYHLVVQQALLPATLAPGFEFDWHERVQHAQPSDCAPVQAQEPVYEIVDFAQQGIRSSTALASASHAFSMTEHLHEQLAVQAGDVFFAHLALDSIAGHSSLVYAPLFLGCTLVFYQAQPNAVTAEDLWHTCAAQKVQFLYLSEQSFQLVARQSVEVKPSEHYDLSQLKKVIVNSNQGFTESAQWVADNLDSTFQLHQWPPLSNTK